MGRLLLFGSYGRQVDRDEANGMTSIALTAEEMDAPHVIVEAINENARVLVDVRHEDEALTRAVLDAIARWDARWPRRGDGE